MTDRKCPLGDDCDLTVAWMAGAEKQREHMHGRIKELALQLGLARIDADQHRARAEAAESRSRELSHKLDELDFLHHEGGPQSVAAMEEALVKSEAALADIAEGEPDPDSVAENVWCKDRAAAALPGIRAALGKATPCGGGGSGGY